MRARTQIRDTVHAGVKEKKCENFRHDYDYETDVDELPAVQVYSLEVGRKKPSVSIAGHNVLPHKHPNHISSLDSVITFEKQ